jgi:hypothetical protein
MYGAEADNVPHALKYRTHPLHSHSREGEVDAYRRRNVWKAKEIKS